MSGLQKFISEEQKKQWFEDEFAIRYMKNVEQGAATQVLAAVGKEFEGKGRIYLDDCQPAEPSTGGQSGHSPWAYDKEKEAKLWEDSLKMVGLTDN